MFPFVEFYSIPVFWAVHYPNKKYSFWSCPQNVSLLPIWIVTTSPCLFTRFPNYIVYRLVWVCINILSSYGLIDISALLLNNCTRNSFVYNCLINNKCTQSIYHFLDSILTHKKQVKIFCILSLASCWAIPKAIPSELGETLGLGKISQTCLPATLEPETEFLWTLLIKTIEIQEA